MPTASLAGAFRAGTFPHQLSWLIDNPLRALLLSPATLLARLPLAGDSRVLEIGPGSGYFSRHLARRLARGLLCLVDLQPQMLRKTRAGMPDGAPAGYAAADAAAPLPFRAAVFDLVLLVAVLGEVPDRGRCLAEAARVLKPGGTLAVHEHISDPDRIPFAELGPLVAAHGFSPRNRYGPGWNYTALFTRST